MPVLVATRWVLLRLFRQLWTLALALLALGVVPLQVALSPLPDPGLSEAVASSWAPAMASLGALAAMIALSRAESFLALLGPALRSRCELAALVAGQLFLLLPLASGAFASGASFSSLAPASVRYLTFLPLVGLGSLLLAAKLPLAPRVAAYVAFAWVLPAACVPGSPARWFAALLDLHSPAAAAHVASLAAPLASAAALVFAGALIRR